MAAEPEAPRGGRAPGEDAAFEVVDALGGLATLVRRSATLDGSVPLRVAQACLPMLEGNAFGWQVDLRARLELKRGLRGWRVAGFSRGEEVAGTHGAAVAGLCARGVLPEGGAWDRSLREGPLGLGARRGLAGRAAPVSLWTGLLVRPRAGVRVRLSNTANRRARTFTVREAVYDDAAAFCPLILEIDPDGEGDGFTLQGEVATLAALPAGARFERGRLEDSPEVARAHLGFFDARYFDGKRADRPARKYRRQVEAHKARRDGTPAGEVHTRVVISGAVTVEPSAPTRTLRGVGEAREAGPPDRLVFRNAMAFRASYDGQDVALDHDRGRLERYAASVRAAWEPVLRDAPAAHPGALLYFTKYFTPHRPGEPNFFVKPGALLQTPRGVSTLLEGLPGPGYDVLRGVVRTDEFHATPAVFQLWQPGRTVEVPEGAPLMHLFPLPRWLQHAGFARVAFAGGT